MLQRRQQTEDHPHADGDQGSEAQYGNVQADAPSVRQGVQYPCRKPYDQKFHRRKSDEDSEQTRCACHQQRFHQKLAH